jgi:hypothetical protein
VAAVWVQTTQIFQLLERYPQVVAVVVAQMCQLLHNMVALAVQVLLLSDTQYKEKANG